MRECRHESSAPGFAALHPGYGYGFLFVTGFRGGR